MIMAFIESGRSTLRNRFQPALLRDFNVTIRNIEGEVQSFIT